ncbi:MAG TPA: FAD-binding domain [Nevskiaceae bacterium]|nr:FAD-binding domain [Nevskiaceae bacterium]
MRVVINGAGIAGTALAFWLGRLGHEVLLVERAPALRRGGYVLNLWGVGYDAAERMGLLPDLLALQYRTEALRMVDRHGRTRGGYPSRVLSQLTRGRIASLARADIAHVIHQALDGNIETLFGDSIAGVDDVGGRVRVAFEHALPREVDLVVGADGLHSRVRQLVFGPDTQFEHPLGCHAAAFEVPGYRPRDDELYVAHSAAGRYIARFPVRDDTMLFFMLFRDEYLDGALPSDAHGRKAALAHIFGDMGWECPAILSALTGVDDVYWDSISQIRMQTWTRGLVALLGDAAACPSLIAGEGSGFALAEAYVLAGEIQRHANDPGQALARYQAWVKPFVERKQKSAQRLVASFVPKTGYGVKMRDFATLLMRLPVFPRLLMGNYLHDEMTLPAYPMDDVITNGR